MNPTLSLIIPMYNEAQILPATVEALRKFADRFPSMCEILLVDDGSTDGSASVAAECIGDDSRFSVIRYPKNKGKGGAVRYGFAHCTGEYAVYTDCDLAYGTHAVQNIYEALLADPEKQIMIGSRNLGTDGYRNYSFLRRVMSKCYLTVIRIAAGFRLSDSQCGIKCFRGDVGRKIFSVCQSNTFAFDLEALLIADRLGYQIGEFGVTIIHHRDSGSKIHPVRDTVRMLRDIGAIKKRIKDL